MSRFQHSIPVLRASSKNSSQRTSGAVAWWSTHRIKSRAWPAGWSASMTDVLRGILYRDLLLALRNRSDIGTALLFFVIVASLFPLGIGAEPALLRAVAPGVIWV